MKHPQLIKFGSIGSPDLGYITVAENSTGLPFEIRRVYWTYFTPQNVQRGRHSHLKLEQIIFAVSGNIECNLETLDGEIFSFKLEDPHVGLYVPANCWRDFRFSHSAVLLCLASMEYSESDYIRDYAEFKRLGNRGK